MTMNIAVFGNIKPHAVVATDVSEEPAASSFRVEDGNSMFAVNVGDSLPARHIPEQSNLPIHL
jgi:hypothetical protein